MTLTSENNRPNMALLPDSFLFHVLALRVHPQLCRFQSLSRGTYPNGERDVSKGRRTRGRGRVSRLFRGWPPHFLFFTAIRSDLCGTDGIFQRFKLRPAAISRNSQAYFGINHAGRGGIAYSKGYKLPLRDLLTALCPTSPGAAKALGAFVKFWRVSGSELINLHLMRKSIRSRKARAFDPT